MNTRFDPSRFEGAWLARPRIPSSILCVDPDAAQRRLSADVLTRCGYSVDSARDSLEGWEALHSGVYDLLITDNDQPRMGGLELAGQARRAGMNLPILIASSSPRVLADPGYEWLHLSAQLQKPFPPDALLKTVRQVLQQEADGRQAPRSSLRGPVMEFRHFTPYFHGGLNE